MAAKYKKTIVDLSADKKVAVYATPRLSHAIDVITADMTLYEGVKFSQIIEAIYEQGKKDGAKNAFEAIAGKVREAEKAVPHRNPGQPKKKPK